MTMPLPLETDADDVPLLAFTVHGDPAPQGSKNGRPIYRGRGPDREFTGKVAMQESSAKVQPWRDAVRQAAVKASGGRPLNYRYPVEVEIVFTRPRPARRPDWWPREWAWGKDMVAVPSCTPDLDKLLRSTSDALGPTTAEIGRGKAKRTVDILGTIADDSLIVRYRDPRKVYPGWDVDALDRPGAVIRIYPWRPPLGTCTIGGAR